MAFTPRDCFIKKCAGFKGFGFTLHGEVENEKVRGFIYKIDAGSPAEQSGLLVGDRLVEVNGVNIEKDSYQQIIERIITSGDEVRLLVVDRETDEYYIGLGMAITTPRVEDSQMDSEPNTPDTQPPSYTDAVQQPYHDGRTQQSFNGHPHIQDTRVIQPPVEAIIIVRPSDTSHDRDTTRLLPAAPRYLSYGAYRAPAGGTRGGVFGAQSDTEDFEECRRRCRLIRMCFVLVMGVTVLIIIAIITSKN